jgi:hypothetical protein
MRDRRSLDAAIVPRLKNGRWLRNGKGCHTAYDAREVIDPENPASSLDNSRELSAAGKDRRPRGAQSQELENIVERAPRDATRARGTRSVGRLRLASAGFCRSVDTSGPCVRDGLRSTPSRRQQVMTLGTRGSLRSGPRSRCATVRHNIRRDSAGAAPRTVARNFHREDGLDWQARAIPFVRSAKPPRQLSPFKGRREHAVGRAQEDCRTREEEPRIYGTQFGTASSELG